MSSDNINKPKNFGSKWTDSERENLLNMISKDNDVDENIIAISIKLESSEGGVRGEIRKMIIFRYLMGDDSETITDDMNLPLNLVSTKERLSWLSANFDLNSTIYMGDGIYDPAVFAKVLYSIAPQNAFALTKKSADFVTKSNGGERAVAEACIHILAKFFSIKYSSILNFEV